MSDATLFFADGDNPLMINAFKQAQSTFKYFWRELSWDYQRIVPALDLACVKVAFTQNIKTKQKPLVEHMWINEIEFDGENINGILMNEPNEITNVSQGDNVCIPVEQISDWLFAINGKTYGGFTIQALRANMPTAERKAHDNAWGLDFGDYKNVLVAYEQDVKPNNLIEHPMSINTKKSFTDFLKKQPKEILHEDEKGYTLLHKQVIAGNKIMVELLLKAGANKLQKTKNGKTALDFAKQMQWEEIQDILSE